MKRAMVFLLCGILLTTSIPVHAEDIQIPQENMMPDMSKFPAFGQLQTNEAEFFKDIENSLANGEEFNLTDKINQNSQESLSKDSMFDMSDTGFLDNVKKDMGMTNLKFETLSQSMKANFEKTDVSGKSMECLGDLQKNLVETSKQFNMAPVELPKDFTMGNLLSSATNSIQSAYSDAINKDSFAGIKNQVSIGKVFNTANQGLSMPGLKPIQEMQGAISQNNQGMKNEMYNKFQQNANNTSGMVGSQAGNLAYNTNKQLMEIQGMLGEKPLDSRVNTNKLTQKSEEIRNMYHHVFPNQYGPIERAKDGLIGIKNKIKGMFSGKEKEKKESWWDKAKGAFD